MEFKLRSPLELVDALDTKTKLIQLLETAAGVTVSQFNDFYKPLVYGLAAYVLECPLQRDAYAEPSGALRFGMTAALFALRNTTTKIFSNGQGSERRRLLSEQYKYAAFAASLASVLPIVHSKVHVTAMKEGQAAVWAAYHAYPQLENWLKAFARADRYEIAWRTNEGSFSQSNAVALSADFFKVGQWQYFDKEVVQDLYDSISPGQKQGKETPLWLTVHEGLTLAHEYERKAAVGTYIPMGMPEGVGAESLAAMADGKQPASAIAQPAPAAPSKPASGAAAITHTSPASERVPQSERTDTAPSAPSQSAEPANPVHESARNLLKTLPSHVAEIFVAIRAKPNYADLKATWTFTDDGLAQITVDTIKSLGRGPTDIATDLKALNLAKTVQGPPPGRRNLLQLSPEATAFLLGEVDAIVQ
ncbi:TraI domain-containing protein [Burkholderia sp. Ac-20365]|uniref:TraI domain-containing protein n=1 Tax=Burkholderia sp. Ac-20365 TaxID=2703897 RepID=UPI00197C4CC1|nr:TraI domain-containing protein [Burkholderia sp. Ac-20365]MBN3761050.1 hypothetical protein [Burkholderia sp. Ac-20365]